MSHAEFSGAVGHMTEPEVLLPVKCPICMRDSLVGFRISVIADAFESGELRLYATCHVVGWDADKQELEVIEYLNAGVGCRSRERLQRDARP